MGGSPRRESVDGGRYRLSRMLGRGGMGEVYEAVHVQTGRRVAVKLLRKIELEDEEATKEIRSRFAREARVMGQIRSENVVEVLDAGVSDDGESFMAMELLDGQDLARLVKELGPLPPLTVIKIGVQAAAGLAKAHALGIIHRDVKPANLFVVHDGNMRTVKIVDFGVARLRPMPDVDLTQDLTTSGAFLGSPVYMSPEQIRRAKQADSRVDAWALCVTLYKLLCGRTPHLNETGLGELLITICCARAPSVQRYAPWVPPALAAILHRGLDLSIDKRFVDIEELGAALRALLPNGIALAASDFRSLTEGEKSTLQTQIETSTTGSSPPEGLVFERHSETATSRAVTTSAVIHPAPRPIPSARTKRLMLAIAVATGIAAGVAGIALMRSSVRSSFGARSTSVGSAAVAIVPAGAGSPVEVAPERTVKVRVGAGLVVEEGNVTFSEEDSAITLRGALGSVHALRVRRGETSATLQVVITDSGPLPSTIDLPAEVAASSSATSTPKSKPAAPGAKTSPPAPAKSATGAATPKTGGTPSKPGSLERWE